MRKQVVLETVLMECGNVEFTIWIEAAKVDNDPYRMQIDYEDDVLDFGLREEDMRALVRQLNAALRERKAMVS